MYLLIYFVRISLPIAFTSFLTSLLDFHEGKKKTAVMVSHFSFLFQTMTKVKLNVNTCDSNII